MKSLHEAISQIRFPTELHRELATQMAEIYAADPAVSAVLLSGSLARERGDVGSDIDLTVLVSAAELDSFQAREAEREPLYARFGARTVEPEPDGTTLECQGKPIHVWYTDGQFAPLEGEGSLLFDHFELQIGNLCLNARPLLMRDDLLDRVRADYLPFYGEELRQQRLGRLRREFAQTLLYIEQAVDRGILFHGFDRLIAAFRCFVLGLFLVRKRYPIDLMKHLEEQMGEWLGRPELLGPMRDVLALPQLDGPTLLARAADLKALWAAETD